MKALFLKLVNYQSFQLISSEKNLDVNWLESLYHLIIGAALSQLTVWLSGHFSLMGILGFVGLFIPIWWCWSGATNYVSRFEHVGMHNQMISLVEIFAFSLLAITVKSVWEGSSLWFALSYCAIRILLILRYKITSYFDDRIQPFERPITAGFMAGVACWVLSLFVPPPVRYYLWYLGIAIDLTTVVWASTILKQNLPHSVEFPKRFGIFTFIISGQLASSIIGNFSDHQLSAQDLLMTLLGLVITYAIWWLYFDELSGAAIELTRERNRARHLQAWVFGHLPFFMSLCAISISIKKLVPATLNGNFDDFLSWFLCGSVALALFSLGLINLASIPPEQRFEKVSWIQHARGGLLVLLIGYLDSLGYLTTFGSLTVVGLVAAICSVQVVLELVENRAFHKKIGALLKQVKIRRSVIKISQAG